MAAVSARDRSGWLELFCEDAVVADPVGPSMFDPTGEGHRGKEAIGRFFDTVSALYASICFDIRDSYLCGDEVANVGTIYVTMEGGEVGEIDGVFVYRASSDGRIASLRAYWEPERIRFK